MRDDLTFRMWAGSSQRRRTRHQEDHSVISAISRRIERTGMTMIRSASSPLYDELVRVATRNKIAFDAKLALGR